jgi:hypothetical protein
VCSEYGRRSGPDASGWCAHRSDLPAEAEAEDVEAAEIALVVVFCPAYAEHEFGDG